MRSAVRSSGVSSRLAWKALAPIRRLALGNFPSGTYPSAFAFATPATTSQNESQSGPWSLRGVSSMIPRRMSWDFLGFSAKFLEQDLAQMRWPRELKVRTVVVDNIRSDASSAIFLLKQR